MRLERFRGHEIGPFKDIDLDLAGMPGPLVAITGPNGIGKSTLLGLMTGGTLYRKLEPHGKLTGLAKARDSYIETTFTAGKRWTVCHTVDAMTGKGTSLVTDADGKPAFGDTSVSSFDVWSKANLTPPSVLYAGPVSAQKSTGFLGMGRAECMSILLRVIGAEHLEKQAELARKRASKALTELDVLRARLIDLETGTTAVAEARAELKVAEEAAAAATQDAEAAREALRRGELAQTDVQAAAEIRSRRQAAEKRVADARTAVADTAERLANNQTLAEDAEAIATAVTLDAQLGEQIVELQASVDRLGAEAEVLHRESAGAHAELQRARDGIGAADAAAKRARARLEDEAIVTAAAATVVAQAARATTAAAAVHAAFAAQRDLEAQQLSHKDDRIDGLRGGLESVLERDTDRGLDAAFEALEVDDKRVARSQQMPVLLAEVRERLTDANHDQNTTASLLQSAEKLAARSGEMDAARADLDAAEFDLGRSHLAEAALAPESLKKNEAASKAADWVKRERQTRDEFTRQRTALEPMLKKAEPLAKSEARIEMLERQAISDAAALKSHEVELAGLPPMPEAGKAVGLEELKRRVQSTDAVTTNSRQVVGGRVARVEAAVKQAEAAEQLRAEIAAAEIEHADWVKLGKDLGRDGLQNSMIDSAVPVLDTHINNLLYSCHGSRWSVSIKTDKLVDKGKSTREALEIRVIDSVTGRDDLASHFSPGEQAILGEAMALALTVLGCECAGTDELDLVRDETGSPLDAENAEAYIKMLRQAAELVGARHIFYVSHDPAIIDAADAKIVIGKGGTVEVVT